MKLRFLAATLLITILALAGAVAAEARPVPRQFVGVNAGGPLLSGDVNLGRQLNAMASNGVRSIRVVFNWAQAQPYPDVPIDFSATDQIVGAAAQVGISVLPTVIYAPSWDLGRSQSGGTAAPARTGPYANYLKALVQRYGPHGQFWASHSPRVPIRAWQIWNEPDLSEYWPQPFVRSYVPLLRAAHDAIKSVDRSATVVLGALTNYSWRDLNKLYGVRGARGLFDVAAVNCFTTTPNNVLKVLHLVRGAMNAHGDRRKPLMLTEFGWPSALGHSTLHYDWDTTEAGQARRTAAVLPMLAKQRGSLGLRAFYYYTWMGQEASHRYSDFDFAGLVRFRSDGTISSKPALAAFRRAVLRMEH